MFLDLSFGPAGGRHSNRSGCARQHSVADRAHRYAPGCSARAPNSWVGGSNSSRSPIAAELIGNQVRQKKQRHAPPGSAHAVRQPAQAGAITMMDGGSYRVFLLVFHGSSSRLCAHTDRELVLGRAIYGPGVGQAQIRRVEENELRRCRRSRPAPQGEGQPGQFQRTWPDGKGGRRAPAPEGSLLRGKYGWPEPWPGTGRTYAARIPAGWHRLPARRPKPPTWPPPSWSAARPPEGD